ESLFPAGRAAAEPAAALRQLSLDLWAGTGAADLPRAPGRAGGDPGGRQGVGGDALAAAPGKHRPREPLRGGHERTGAPDPFRLREPGFPWPGLFYILR